MKQWFEWRDIQIDGLPSKDGPVIVCAESADPEKPLITTAWYDPEFGWSLMIAAFIPSITHWMHLPPNPLRK